MLTRKLLDKDPSVQLVKPQKTSKSCAWSTDCFLLVFHNNVKENFVYCQVCSNLITYNSIYGTGSLLRHNCYKRMMKVEAAEGRSPLTHSTPKHQLKQLCIENGHDESSAGGGMTLAMKCRDNSKIKKEIEEMISLGDASFEMRPPGITKSDVWRNGNFRIVYRDGNKLDFVMCMFCNSLITYKSKTGTASLLRHSCIKRMLVPKAEDEQHAPSEEEVHTVVGADNEHFDEAESTADNNVEHFTFVNETEADNEQYLVAEFPDEFKDEAMKLFHYFNFKDMQPINLTHKKGFLSLAQYLINVGAEYGKVSVESIMDTKAEAFSSTSDSFTNILQKMLKSKLEDNKASLSCDYWADNNRKLNFFTLYGHYISDSFELKKLNLGTVSFTEQFTAIDYKLLVTSILEGYFSSEAEIDGFLAKTTIVTFDHMKECTTPYATIDCASSKLNCIVQTLMDDFRDVIPADVMASESWHAVWEYLATDNATTHNKAIDQLRQILEPFTRALKSLCIDQKPTINEVFVFRKKLEDHFKSRRASMGKVCDTALKLIREHFPITDLHKVAIFLDPRFKSLKFMSATEKANVLALVDKMLNVNDADDPDASGKTGRDDKKPNVACAVDDSTDSAKYLIEYMDFDEERDEKHDEIDTYMNLKFNDIYSTNILEFWESRYDLPHLRQLAKETLCIPATAIVGQKHFNDDAMLLAKRRLNMEIDNIKQMLYIHENFDLLSNVL